MGLNATGRCPVAYAIVVAEDGVSHIAVELHDVRFRKVHFLEVNEDPEQRRYAVDRLNNQIFDRSMNDYSPGWLPTSLEKR